MDAMAQAGLAGWVERDGVQAVAFMVSTERKAGNEKPRAGVGAGFLTEPG
jgi:hypothetical protein